MDDEHDLTDDEFNNFDWTRWHYEGKHFEARAVSRSEFEALKRFGDYEELPNSILMRIEGDKEFRIYCDDVEKWSFGSFSITAKYKNLQFTALFREVCQPPLDQIRNDNGIEPLSRHCSMAPGMRRKVVRELRASQIKMPVGLRLRTLAAADLRQDGIRFVLDLCAVCNRVEIFVCLDAIRLMSGRQIESIRLDDLPLSAPCLSASEQPRTPWRA